MTVLQVCAYAAPYEGNFIKSLKALSDELAQQGHKMIYAFPESARDIDWCKELSCKTDVFFLPLAKARILPKTYSCLKKIYKKYSDLQIINSHFELYDIPTSLTCPRNVKLFWHLHDAIEGYNSFKERLMHKLQYGLLYRNAKLLSVSKKHMEYVLKIGFPQNHAVFIPNGLDLNRIVLVNNSDEKKYDFLIFGWEFERKGVDLCIDAMKKIEQKINVAIIGNENTVQIINEKYREVPGISVIEPVADINKLYNICRCFLHISRAEGLSYALLEAVYAGLPVICSDIPENQFAEQFPTVTMVKSQDIDSISKAMKNQLSADKITTEAIDYSRKQIEKEYSVYKWAKNMLKHYGV